jgi:hypothetical protein
LFKKEILRKEFTITVRKDYTEGKFTFKVICIYENRVKQTFQLTRGKKVLYFDKYKFRKQNTWHFVSSNYTSKALYSDQAKWYELLQKEIDDYLQKNPPLSN